MLGRQSHFITGLVLWGGVCARLAFASSESESAHQQEQQRERAAFLKPNVPNVRMFTAAGSAAPLSFPAETPCFPINSVELEGKEFMPGAAELSRLAKQGEGQCLGQRGIHLIMSTVQNHLTESGWVTTRVVAPSQDIRQGRLRLVIIPGRVERVRFGPDSSDRLWLFSAVPSREGDLLDLRDLEQGLENLQRPGTVKAAIDIVPGQQPGYSDIVIGRTQPRWWRLSGWIHDGGRQRTGRYLGGIMLALDNPLGVSDIFSVSAGRDSGFGGQRYHKSLDFQYSFPVGYWQLALSGGRYQYQHPWGQHRYYGQGQYVNSQINRVLHRGRRHKTSVKYDVQAGNSLGIYNEQRLSLHDRRTSSWRIGVDHRHYLAAATLDVGTSYQQGVRWFGAMPAHEEKRGDGTALAKIQRWHVNVNLPFSLAGEKFRYITRYMHQLNFTPLTQPDRLYLGSRSTVRGFDLEQMPGGDRGWFWRNELAWRTPLPNQEFYIGTDYGEVSGGNLGDTKLAASRNLAGGVTGLRGTAPVGGIYYDIFAGAPLSKPKGRECNSLALGFVINWQYSP